MSAQVYPGGVQWNRAKKAERCVVAEAPGGRTEHNIERSIYLAADEDAEGGEQREALESVQNVLLGIEALGVCATHRKFSIAMRKPLKKILKKIGFIARVWKRAVPG